MTRSFPFNHHPCWSDDRTHLWERIHLPVARRCNLRCIYCTTMSSCHGAGPGSCERTMTPDEAMEILQYELTKRKNLKIIGFSGPGEPLYNQETFTLLDAITSFSRDLKICLSTNGILLSKKLDALCAHNLSSISVSMSAIEPETASVLYRYAVRDIGSSRGIKMGTEIINLQLEGIRAATRRGIPVKVNSILIPNMNSDEMEKITMEVKDAGAILQNIIPLFPRGNLTNVRPPTLQEITQARSVSGKHLRQFYHCKQCRSDVVGIPGKDSIISRSL